MQIITCESPKIKPFLVSNFNRRKRIEEEILVYEAAVPAKNTKSNLETRLSSKLI